MSTFPDLLKTWRRARRFSQLQLALEADVSARHISFLETGRAQPSREMIARLGEALQAPMAARNQMLLQAGFAARYPAREWDAAEMAPIRAAVDHMMAAHAPYPALAVDRLWTVMQMNAPAAMLFGTMGVAPGDSLLDLMLSDHLPGMIENWPTVAHHTARRLRTESAAQGGVEALDHVADALAQTTPPDTSGDQTVVPAIYRAGPLRLSLFGTIAQFGTPEDVLLDDLKIEMYFPADEETAAALRAMAGG